MRKPRRLKRDALGRHRLIHNRPWCKLRDEDGTVRLARPLDGRGHSSAYGIGRIAPSILPKYPVPWFKRTRHWKRRVTRDVKPRTALPVNSSATSHTECQNYLEAA